VTKFGVIIPICCIIAVSGCALYDSAEVTTETPAVSIPVVESEAVQPVSDVKIATKSDAALELGRSASVEDIRRLQRRLRDFGFEPGPVDGVAGVKTKTAFARLQAGCAKLEPLSEHVPIVANGMAGPPNRDDTIKMQSELRRAGFDPGPVDGIFGTKTKSVISYLETGCFMAKDLDGRLGAASRAGKNESPRALTAAAPKPSDGLNWATVAVGNDAANPVVANQTVRPQEEVRILQLRLRDAGFDPGPFDGVMGQRTKLALEQYEASQRNRKTKTSLKTTAISGQY
jgi:peptidoglycan hydrolase-like protein with peptidoglycan-binding domain